MNDVEFWSNVDQSGGPDACWPWLRYRDEDGYGRVKRGGRLVKAHRVAFELSGGVIPEGHGVLHSCPGGDRPECCNPKHLRAGTQKDNVRDMRERGRAYVPRGVEHPRARLTDAEVAQIRALAGLSKREIGRRFGVSDQYVGLILSGRRR